jgi:hypothetical protein
VWPYNILEHGLNNPNLSVTAFSLQSTLQKYSSATGRIRYSSHAPKRGSQKLACHESSPAPQPPAFTARHTSGHRNCHPLVTSNHHKTTHQASQTHAATRLQGSALPPQANRSKSTSESLCHKATFLHAAQKTAKVSRTSSGTLLGLQKLPPATKHVLTTERCGAPIGVKAATASAFGAVSPYLDRHTSGHSRACGSSLAARWSGNPSLALAAQTDRATSQLSNGGGCEKRASPGTLQRPLIICSAKHADEHHNTPDESSLSGTSVPRHMSAPQNYCNAQEQGTTWPQASVPGLSTLKHSPKNEPSGPSWKLDCTSACSGDNGNLPDHAYLCPRSSAAAALPHVQARELAVPGGSLTTNSSPTPKSSAALKPGSGALSIPRGKQAWNAVSHPCDLTAAHSPPPKPAAGSDIQHQGCANSQLNSTCEHPCCSSSSQSCTQAAHGMSHALSQQGHVTAESMASEISPIQGTQNTVATSQASLQLVRSNTALCRLEHFKAASLTGGQRPGTRHGWNSNLRVGGSGIRLHKDVDRQAGEAGFQKAALRSVELSSPPTAEPKQRHHSNYEDKFDVGAGEASAYTRPSPERLHRLPSASSMLEKSHASSAALAPAAGEHDGLAKQTSNKCNSACAMSWNKQQCTSLDSQSTQSPLACRPPAREHQ